MDNFSIIFSFSHSVLRMYCNQIFRTRVYSSNKHKKKQFINFEKILTTIFLQH